MKNRINHFSLLSLFIVFSLNIFGQNNTKTISENYANGQLKSVISYVDTTLNGYHLTFDPYARLQLQEFYNMGKLHGMQVEYENGRINTLKEYNNGVLDGRVEKYYVSRRLMSQESYKNGIKDGESKWYYQDGKIFALYNYSQGQIVNPVKTFYNNGSLKSQYNMDKFKMNGDYTEYHEDGKTVKVIGKYKDGKKIGRWETYDSSGKLIKKDKY